MTTRPDPTEYPPYYGKYIALVPDGLIETTFAHQGDATLALLRAIPEEQAGYAYAPGKWSIKEVLGHLMDTERIFAYRALCISRNDSTPVPGLEQDVYVTNGNFNARSLTSLLEEFAAVRQASVHLFRHLTDEQWQRRGMANGKEISARALAYNIAGHELHHAEILKSLYLVRANS